jgi:Fe-S-cluster containining protein
VNTQNDPQVKQPIATLEALYEEFDRFYENIGAVCAVCQDPDCQGYIWTLPAESDTLLNQDVPIIEINCGPTFIHSFVEQDGVPDLSVRSPRCGQLCEGTTRQCRIYRYRPLVCRIYPLGLETESDGTTVWALHLDCEFVRRLERAGACTSFEDRARELLGRIASPLYEEIVMTYQAVNDISSFPEGRNHYRQLLVATRKQGE